MSSLHADLIGFRVEESSGDAWVVTGPCAWSEQYVNIKYDTGHETIKPVAVVRRHKQLIGG